MSMRSGVPKRRVATPLMLAGAMVAVGCTQLTKVSAPDALQASQLGTPNGAQALRVGGIGLFYSAVIYDHDGIPSTSGWAGDELVSTQTGGGEVNIDARRLPPNPPDVPYGYDLWQGSRVNLLHAIQELEHFSSVPRAYTGQSFAFIGLTETMFAELFCSGLPLSDIVNNAPQYGQPLTTAALLGQAVKDLDSAIVYAADTERFLDFARVGAGRALLDLGRFQDAAAAVSAVPTAFAYVSEVPLGSTSGIWSTMFQPPALEGVGDRKGGNGLNYVSANDPRVPTQNEGLGLDGATVVYGFLPYDSPTHVVVLASGVEARLIEAEAKLQAGDIPGWAGTLNTLRQTAITPAMDTLKSDSTTLASPTMQVDVMFRERAFWLYLTGHRLGDMRRLIRQYGRTQDHVFPVGPYRTFGSFGTDVNLAIPHWEDPNPNFHGCLDRNA